LVRFACVLALRVVRRGLVRFIPLVRTGSACGRCSQRTPMTCALSSCWGTPPTRRRTPRGRGMRSGRHLSTLLRCPPAALTGRH